MQQVNKLILKQNNLIVFNQLLIMKALVPLQKDVDFQLELMAQINSLENVVETTQKELTFKSE
jgi:hypothetical protein